MAIIFSHKNISIMLGDEEIVITHYSKAEQQKKSTVFNIEQLLSALEKLTDNSVDEQTPYLDPNFEKKFTPTSDDMSNWIETQLEGKPSNLKTK